MRFDGARGRKTNRIQTGVRLSPISPEEQQEEKEEERGGEILWISIRKQQINPLGSGRVVSFREPCAPPARDGDPAAQTRTNRSANGSLFREVNTDSSLCLRGGRGGDRGRTGGGGDRRIPHGTGRQTHASNRCVSQSAPTRRAVCLQLSLFLWRSHPHREVEEQQEQQEEVGRWRRCVLVFRSYIWPGLASRRAPLLSVCSQRYTGA